MATDNLLFNIDTIVADGIALSFESATGMIVGAARFQNQVVVSASGDDFNKRTRVPTFFKCKIQWGAGTNPETFTAQQSVQITARDQQSGRRALMPKCSFGDLGEIGGGAVDITYNVLSPIQWL